MAKKSVQKKGASETALVPVVPQEVIEAFKSIEEECKSICSMESGVDRFFATARITQQLQAAFDQPGVMTAFMSLQGSPLGFKTDKDNKGGYPVQVVRDALVAGFMYGVAPVDNQMNIIAGQCYVGKKGFQYKLRNDKKVIDSGLTNFRLDNFRFVRLSKETGTMVVSCEVFWTQNEQDFSHVLDEIHVQHVFPSASYSGGSLDQAYGKAERKAYAWLYNKITGDRVPDGEASEIIEGNQFIDVTAQEVEDESVSDETRNYLMSLLNNEVISETSRKAILDKWNGLDEMTQEQAEKRIGALIARIRKHGGKIPGHQNMTEEDSISDTGTDEDEDKDMASSISPEKNVASSQMQEKAQMVKELSSLGVSRYGKDWPAKQKEILNLIGDKKALHELDQEEAEMVRTVIENGE